LLLQVESKHTLEQQENLFLKQAEIVDIGIEKDKVKYVETNIGAIYNVDSVIIATGTYLRGRIHIGEENFESGPDGVFPSIKLAEVLKNLGIEIFRFKTGTPARINRRSVDFSKMEIQEGDDKPEAFSLENKIDKDIKQLPCYLTYTNEKTHEVIRKNLHRSPLYSGKMEGTGPRYCPSIEDKVVRFADKERHQIFIEPMGENTEEMIPLIFLCSNDNLSSIGFIQSYSMAYAGLVNSTFSSPAIVLYISICTSSGSEELIPCTYISSVFSPIGSINI